MAMKRKNRLFLGTKPTKQEKNETKKTESNLKKIGVPSAYIGVTALLVTFLCNNLGVCG